MRAILRKFELSIYHYTLHVIHAHPSVVDGMVQSKFPQLAAVTPAWDETIGRTAWDEGSQEVLVYIASTMDVGDLISTIAHESSHVVDFIWQAIGAGYEEGSEEPRAYLMGAIAQSIYDTVKSKNPRAKKRRGSK